ncbi:MAG: hypothetical protein M5R36_10510 [Deltaproteobacteria bacterium]|nr:hypothetical protein [Deltaproteobacteria bacterium]
MNHDQVKTVLAGTRTYDVTLNGAHFKAKSGDAIENYLYQAPHPGKLRRSASS